MVARWVVGGFGRRVDQSSSRLGKADLPGIEREVGRKKWIEYCCLKNEALFEEIRKRCLAQNTFETSAPLIMDMRDLGTHHAWGVPLFKAMLDVTEPNFPERLSATYIVNAPAVFSWLYGMVKGVLNPGTAAKVQVFGASDDHLKALLEVMPRSTIPTDLGGRRRCLTRPWVAPCRAAMASGHPGSRRRRRPLSRAGNRTPGAYDTRMADSESMRKSPAILPGAPEGFPPGMPLRHPPLFLGRHLVRR